MSRKAALIIGNSRYDDTGLARITTAGVDVREFAEILRVPEIGQFDEVVELPDEGLAVVRRSIARFFSQAKKDDLLVFYFSGHGIKDENGHLYLAVRDTEPHLLAGTSIEAAFVTTQMDRCASKRQILILDCCHSGAFAYGTKAGAAQAVGTAPAFEGTGYGRVVLTATDSTQYAWQGDQIIGESDKSVFTHYLLEGLRTGEADRDSDGLITIDELYEYVYERVVSETPRQTPGKWSYKQQGDIVIARNPRPLARAAELPLELRALLESSLSRLRAEAIPELAALLKGRHRGLALAARKALDDLLADDSRKVSAAAEAVLATLFQRDETVAADAREAERIQREVDQLVVEASQRLAREDLSGALSAVHAAQELDPSSSAADRLQGQIHLAIEEARQREELERQIEERRQKVAGLIDSANHAASPQSAIEMLREALELEPGHEVATQLLSHHTAALEHMAAERVRLQEIAAAQRRIEDLLRRDELHLAEQALAVAEESGRDPSAFKELRRRLHDKQQERIAIEAVEAVRGQFASDPESAVAALERFRPRHPLVSRALADLAKELDRIRRQEEERRRSEAERQARERKLDTLRTAARLHIERREFVEALRELQEIRQLAPKATGLEELVETAEAGRAADEEAQRRRRESEGKLATASKRFLKHDFARALALAEEACRIDPENSAASALRDEITEALNERAASVDSAGSTGRPGVVLRSVVASWPTSRWFAAGLAVVLLAGGLFVFGVPRRDLPPPENTESHPAPSAAAPQETPSPAPVVPSLQSETAPLVPPFSGPANTKPLPRATDNQSNAPAASDAPRASPSRSAASPPSTPSDSESRITRVLAEGDRLTEARNYQGALLAYEEAGRLGSAEGLKRAEAVRQERASQVRLRLNTVDRLQDAGDYEQALRLIDEALKLEPKSPEVVRLRQQVLDAQSFERTFRAGSK